MKKFAIVFAFVVGLGLAACAYAQGPADPAADQYIVMVEEGQDPGFVAAAHGLLARFTYRKAINGFAGTVPPGRLKALAGDPRVALVAQDHAVHLDGKPAPPAPAPTVPEGVKRIGAWPTPVLPNNVPCTGKGVGVAIVDSGLDFNHADLKELGSASFNAYGAPPGQDENGHGTHVGGIVAARNNNQDVVGVAPEATLYAVRVFPKTGSAADSVIIAGLDWVLANATAVVPAIKVVNMSLGRGKVAGDDTGPLHAAVQRVVAAGITVVVSAGNDNTKEVKDRVPAGFPEVIAVASTTAKDGAAGGTYGYMRMDTASSFTTDGAMDSFGVGVAISAPGEDQENVSRAGRLSTVGILSTKLGGGTTRMSGTSMSAPHVTGVVALLYQQNASLLPDAAKLKVMNGVLVDTAPYDSTTSAGYTVNGYTFDLEREGILYAPSALGL